MANEEKESTKKTAEEFKYKKDPWWPLWSLFMIPFLLVFKPLYEFVKNEVNWTAAWLAVLVFELLLNPAEYYSLSRGHWIYNESRIWGPKIFGIPIEEPLLYYLFSPLILICLLHFVRKKFVKK